MRTPDMVILYRRTAGVRLLFDNPLAYQRSQVPADHSRRNEVSQRSLGRYLLPFKDQTVISTGWQPAVPHRRLASHKETAPDTVHLSTLVPADTPPVTTGGGNMNTTKQIDSCIDLLRKMLGDPNNELSSEQQSKLKKGIRDLKRLQRATRLTQKQVFRVVSQIAEAAFEILESGQCE
jgi:hypothetical protein